MSETPIEVHPSKPEYSDSLQTAERGSFVRLDKKGQVVSKRSHRRKKRILVAYFIGAPVLLAFVSPAAAIGGAAMSGFSYWQIRRARAMVQAIQCLAVNDAEGALRILQQIEKRRWQSKRTRGLLHHNLAVCHLLRAEPEIALEHACVSEQFLCSPGRASRALLPSLVLLHKVVLLARLGRIDEAKKLVKALSTEFVRESAVLRVGLWSSELYVAFIDDSHELSRDELHNRARFALGMSNPRALLPLTAWAHSHLGDEDQAKHLAREALERTCAEVEQGMPKLWAWLKQYSD